MAENRLTQLSVMVEYTSENMMLTQLAVMVEYVEASYNFLTQLAVMVEYGDSVSDPSARYYGPAVQ